MKAIEVEKLTKVIVSEFRRQKKTLLHGINFSVDEGAMVGFVGPNGAGKSTTLRHLIGGTRPTSGTARIFGNDPCDAATRRALGYLPDIPALAGNLTASETLRLHAALIGVPVDLTLLERVGLEAEPKARTRSYSKGMMTRLGLALALAGRPRLLLLDEPMSGLDPVGRRGVRDLLREEHKAGTTIFFSSHVLSDVESLCHDVVVLNRGHILYSGAVAAAIGPERPARVIVVVGSTSLELLAKHGTVERWGDELAVTVGEDPFAVAADLGRQGVKVLEIRRPSTRLEDSIVHLMKGDAA